MSTLIIRALFFIAGVISLYFSQSERVPFSWAMFLCLVTAVCVTGALAWESKK